MKIAIASGKGGTGKTTLSVNLASFLSARLNKFVVLCDLDVEEPDSGIFFKSAEFFREDKYVLVPKWDESKCTNCGNCIGICNFNAIAKLPSVVMVFEGLCHSCHACSDLCPSGALPMHKKKVGVVSHFKHNNLDFVEGRLDVGIEQAVPLIKMTKDYVKTNSVGSSVEIYDCPPGTSCSVIEAVKDIDFTILVTEPTVFGFHDLKLAVETMRKLGNKFGVVINRFGIGNDEVLDWCNKESVPIIGKIRNSVDIAKKCSAGKLIYDTFDDVEQELKNIFNNIKKMLN